MRRRGAGGNEYVTVGRRAKASDPPPAGRPQTVEGKHIKYLRYYRRLSSSTAAAQGNQFYNFGGQGFGVGQQGSNITTAEGLPQNQTSAPILPNYLGLPFRIMVSPFVNYDPTTRKTDLMMFNSSQLGAMVVKQAPQVMSWDDNRYGIDRVRTRA